MVNDSVVLARDQKELETRLERGESLVDLLNEIFGICYSLNSTMRKNANGEERKNANGEAEQEAIQRKMLAGLGNLAFLIRKIRTEVRVLNSDDRTIFTFPVAGFVPTIKDETDPRIEIWSRQGLLFCLNLSHCFRFENPSRSLF